MTTGQRFQEFLIWSIAAILVICIALVLFIYNINRNDQPPSEAALRMQAAWDNRLEVADEDNAYVYFMGFSVPPTESPMEWGKKRIEWARQAVDSATVAVKEKPPGEVYQYTQVRSDNVQALVDVCRNPVTECWAALKNGPQAVSEWTETESWLLERYKALLSHSDWRESLPSTMGYQVRELELPYSMAFDGQRLLLINAWVSTGEENTPNIKALLETDITFWRALLVSADSLITKMVATAALKKHFVWSNVILRQLPEDTESRAMPDSWLIPINSEEKSIARALRSEWLAFDVMVRNLETQLASPNQIDDASDGLERKSAKRRISDLLQRHYLQPQETSNLQAEYLEKLSAILDVSYSEQAPISERAEEWRKQFFFELRNGLRIYNRVGRILVMVGLQPNTHDDYANRVADLEGVRLAALAVMKMRTRNTLAGEVVRHLAQSEYRNPYNNKPFEWDEDQGVVVFEGLANEKYRRHVFLL